MRSDKKDLLLYAVTDRHWLSGRKLSDVVKESLEGGVTFVQLREKELDEEIFLKEAKELKELCRQYNVPFVIKWMPTEFMWGRAIWKRAMCVPCSGRIR